jgi:hypothetical protein
MLYGHEGQFKTKERIIESYWWRGIDKDTNDFLAERDNCQKTKKFKQETMNFSHYLNALNQTKGHV